MATLPDRRPLGRVFDRHTRLQPRLPDRDLESGFRAEVHDAAWFLGRQWQMGELQGENASSPTLVRAKVDLTPLEGDSKAPIHDPTVTPPEAIIEAEAEDWWTYGRRVQFGRLLAPRVDFNDLKLRKACQISGFPKPYDRLNGRGLDGLALWQNREKLGLRDDDFPELPPLRDAWRYDAFHYEDRFTAGGATVNVPRHKGGAVDWFSAEAKGRVRPAKTVDTVALVNRFTFPGAPHPRYWRIEDHAVGIGGVVPDRSSFVTTLALNMVMQASDNWFSFVVPCASGHVVRLHSVEVTDAFGDTYAVSPDPDGALYRVSGMGADTLVIWPRVIGGLGGAVEETVLVGLDEDANRVWAVETRLGGAQTDAGREDPEARVARMGAVGAGPASTSARARLYKSTTRLPLRWHPYEVGDVAGKRAFLQGRLANLATGDLLPAPISALLADPNRRARDPVHAIVPREVPQIGLELDRRWMAARRTDGMPMIWRQKRSRPLLDPPLSGLEFDQAISTN